MQEKIKQLIDLSLEIAAKQSSHTVTIYGIQNKQTGALINHKSRIFYATREGARSVRREIDNSKLRVVKAEFINATEWKTSK
jgi:hypothetical protein